MDASGSRQVTIPPPHPGSYRVYADVQATGADRITLGTDIQVPDPVPSVALPAVSATAEIDGYHVSMSGVPVAGASTIEFDISLDGQVVVTEPYLGAAGRLVVIRTGDLGYLRLKPGDESDSCL